MLFFFSLVFSRQAVSIEIHPVACYGKLTRITVDFFFSYLGQQHRDVTWSLVRQVVNPALVGFKHCVFMFHIEVIVLDKNSQLLQGEIQQLR